ncbi:hypothetical protein GC207_14010 [bacterium]|nr:hypothetical protein [bacterium]
MIAIVIMGGLVAVAAAVLIQLHRLKSKRPPIPNEWVQIRIGMTRSEVHAQLGGRFELVDLRELKGFETMFGGETASRAGFRWDAEVFYDSADRVEDAWAHCIHSDWGFLNTTVHLVDTSP